MIQVKIFYKGKGDSAKRFAREMTSLGIVERIRKQAGNLKYEYYLPLNDESTIMLLDEWEDQEALDMHHRSPMMQEIIDLREKHALSMRVEKYILKQSESTKEDKRYIIND